LATFEIPHYETDVRVWSDLRWRKAISSRFLPPEVVAHRRKWIALHDTIVIDIVALGLRVSYGRAAYSKSGH
jgi:hypothetical protein